MERVTRVFSAPAKINLCLHVLGRRADGYHELSMVMQRVSLCDRIQISLTEAPGVRVACSDPLLPVDADNIAGRAAKRLLEKARRSCGVEIVIEKNIPVAAGLGGGSSDAAAVLTGLNQMLELGLGREELMAEGVCLGADVPFFIFGETAWATGIGEVLAPFEIPLPLWYVLVNPGFAVSTAWVYGNLELTTPGTVAKMPGFPRKEADLASLLHNDLERVTAGRFPDISRIKDRLLSLGAFASLMSGSGPTVFGVFSDESTALKAAEACGREPGWKTFAVRPI